MNTPISNMDPYVYEGTSVLRNLRDIRDREQLSRFESDMTSRRLAELKQSAEAGRFDPAHLRAIHHYIFQDVFEWAGKFRTVNISRSDQYYFAFWDRIEAALFDTLARLTKERHLAGLAPPAFSSRAGFFLGEINAVHPFRDGNGRTQREFIRQLAVRNGYPLNWQGVTREQMGAASKLSFQKGDNTALAELIESAIQT